MASFAAWHTVKYSASTDEGTTDVFLFTFHKIALFPIRYMYALIDLWSSQSPAQSESENPAVSAMSPPPEKIEVQYTQPEIREVVGSIAKYT